MATSSAKENRDGLQFMPQHYALATLVKMNQLRKNNVLCDVVLMVGTHQVPAHRVVLAGCSSYFCAMFTGPMSESKQEIIQIKGVEPDVLELLIEFAYTSQLEVTIENVQGLLSAASLMQLNCVIEICCDFLEKQLTPSNAIGIRSFAELHTCEELLITASDYVLEHFVEVTSSEEFLSLTHTQVGELIDRDDINIPSEEHVYEAVIRWVEQGERFEQDRTQYLPELLNSVRLPLLSTVYLVDKVSKENLVRNNPSCMELLDEAKNFHLLPGRRPKLHCSRTEPRKSTAGVLYCVGGHESSSNVTSSVECFSLRKNEWSLVAPMTKARTRMGVAVLDNKMYAMGGTTGGMTLNSVECYDPVQNKWTNVTPMRIHRSGVGAAVLGGRIFAVGGDDGVTHLNSAECYDAQLNEWGEVVRPMGTRRCFPGVVAYSGWLYVAGGTDGVRVLNSVERYHPHSAKWSPVAPMVDNRQGFGLCVLHGRIYAVGGHGTATPIDKVEAYDPRVNKWETVASLKTSRDGVGVAILSDKIYAVGGFDRAYLNSVECFDPRLLDWVPVTPMTTPRAVAGVAVLGGSDVSDPDSFYR
ncbi:hypothetical protein ACHWQZ_G019438 [Mnemiopsis leidyi]